jgi:AcrR family transcriptional regulator
MPKPENSPACAPRGRERLLAAAVRQFAAKGYAATTVRDILRAAEVTAPVLYYHFGSKEGLFLALAQQGLEKIESSRRLALTGGGTAAERIRRVCRASAEVKREWVDLIWVVEAILSGPPEAAPRFDFAAPVGAWLELLEELIREGVAGGEFRPCNPTHVALVLTGALEVSTRPHVFNLGREDAGAQLDGMLSVVLAGLALEAPSGHRRRG